MRIAFASCFSAESFNNQPVWDEVAAVQPDVLLLLGDAIYMDCGNIAGLGAVQAMTEFQFATRAEALYRAQIAQAGFAKLVKKASITTYAIWDDHDFLWDNARGADAMAAPQLRPLVFP